MIEDAAWLTRQGWDTLREAGMCGLASWIHHLLVGFWRLIRFDGVYLVHVTTTGDYAAMPPLRAMGELSVHFLDSERDADRLVENGFQDVRRVIRPAARRLRRGAICVGVFIDREIAHVEWLALSEEVRRAVFSTPCYVDFAGGEAAWGGAHTVSRYRGKGVFQYGMACALRYCHEHGHRALVGVTAVGNAPSVSGQTPYAPRVRVRLRHDCRLLRCKWTELSRESYGDWPAEGSASAVENECSR